MSIVSLSNLKVEKSKRKGKNQSIPDLSSFSTEYSNPDNNKQTKKIPLKTLVEKDKKKTISNLKSNQLVISKQSISNLKSNQLVISKQSISNQKAINKCSISNQLVIKKKPISNQLVIYTRLTGIEKRLVEIIFASIRYSDNKNSAPLSADYLATELRTTKKYIKTATQRLIEKGYINRRKGKQGKGGWSVFSINSAVYQEMAQSILVIKKESNSNQIVINKESNRLSPPPSSSSYFNNNTTTKSTCVKNEPDFDKSTQLSENVIIPNVIKKIGFGKGQLNQLEKIGKLSVEELQTSLEHFTFDLGGGHIKIKTNPLNMLMGILRQGVFTSNEYLKEEENELQYQLIMLREKEAIRQQEKKEYEYRLFKEWKLTKSLQEMEEIKNKIKLRLKIKNAKDVSFRIGEDRSKNKDEVLDYFLKNERDAFEKEMFSS